jgi:hypothetical protein
MNRGMVIYEVRKCAKLCLVSVCMTCIGEISKVKYAPGWLT